jgi:SEC-C motif domain protein
MSLALNISSFCPCGSGLEYSQCCAPFLAGDKFPPTAEALMRSRFTAYSMENTDYIKATWDKASQPDQSAFSDEAIAWQRLEIIDTKKGGVNDNKGIVEFKAYYSNKGEDFLLHEVSRFAKTNERWFYIDGVVKKVGKIIQQQNLGKNAPCPCGSGKKFKRCCGAG